MTDQSPAGGDPRSRAGQIDVLPEQEGRFDAEPVTSRGRKAPLIIVSFVLAIAAVGGVIWVGKAWVAQHQATEAAKRKEKEELARAEAKRAKKEFTVVAGEAASSPSAAAPSPSLSGALPSGFGASAPATNAGPIPLKAPPQKQLGQRLEEPGKPVPSSTGKPPLPPPVVTMMVAGEPASVAGRLPATGPSPSPAPTPTPTPTPEDSIATYKARVDALQAQAAGKSAGPGFSGGQQGSPIASDSAPLASALGSRRGRTVQEFARLNALRSPVTSTHQAQAAVLGDRSLLLARGAVVQCVLLTQLHSNVPGTSSCVVPEDVWSDDGRVLLIPKGSTFTGSYQGPLRNGDSRIAVVWHRLKSTDGVVVDVESPGADGVGTMGVDGYVDNHWGKRIGAALLLSLIDDAVSIEVAKQSQGSASRTPTATTDTTKSMSEQVLSSTINIPPTISKNRGARLAIIVQRDLWFDSVYSLVKR